MAAMDHSMMAGASPASGMAMGGMDHSMMAGGGAPPMSMSMPAHGSYPGHALPGSFFIIWSVWWMFSVYAEYLTKQRARKAFRSKTWYPWPYKPCRNFEPCVKLFASVLGALVELRLGHDAWRRLYKSNGQFEGNYLNNWQHALMYGGVGFSALVDLAGCKRKLPQGTEQAYLTIAFLIETLLMGLHKKHTDLDILVHQLLTWVMIGTTVVCFLEIWITNNVLLSTMRPMLVLFQGTWFIQVGHIMFLGIPAWDPSDHAALNMVPVVFCVHIVCISVGFLTVFLVMQWLYDKGDGAGGGAASRDIIANDLSDLELADQGVQKSETKVLIAKEYRD